MAQRSPTIECDAMLLDEARCMSRATRMNPEICNAHKRKIQFLDNTATRMPLPEGTSAITIKKRVLRVAAKLGILVTSAASPAFYSSGTRPIRISSRPQRSPHGSKLLRSHHKQHGAADADMASAVRQRRLWEILDDEAN